jgi:catechol 2,3-dioxygenase-like lactoylglutathione lyase family enzyme
MNYLNINKVQIPPSIRKSFITTIILFSTILFSNAQQAFLPETEGAFYAISVHNINKTIDWYTKYLGFKVEFQGGNDQRKGALLSRPGIVLELGEFSSAIRREDIKPNLESHEIYGIFKIGFMTKNLDETFKTLKDSNVEIFFSIVTTSDGNRTFGIKDLEGNIIQFFGK